MPSNVFIYQLPKKTFVENADYFIMEDVEGTKQASVSALRTFFFRDFVVPVLSATEFHATSAYFSVTDITRYELSAFNVMGTLGINTPAPKASIHITATDQIILPKGTTGERPSGLSDLEGGLRYNTTLKTFEGNKGSTNGGWSSLGDTTSAVFASEAIGGITAGYQFPANTSLQFFLDKLFSRIFVPTLFDPSITFTTSLDTAEIEPGSQSVTLTMGSYNRGEIRGSLDPAQNNAWNPGRKQNDRGGAIFNYVIEGFATNNTTRTVTRTFEAGNNSFTAGVNIAAGPQPTDSAGNNFSTPWPAGEISAPNRVLVAQRRAFFRADNAGAVLPTLGSQVRDLATGGGGYVHGPANGTVFNINVPIGANRIIFAFPQTLGPDIKVEYVEDGFTDQTDEFDRLDTIQVGGLANYSPVLYYIYYTFPLIPFTDTATFRVTIL